MEKKLLFVTLYIVVIIVLVVIFILKNMKQNKKLKKAISELEKEKNLIISAPILNELTKVESLVKDDKAKYKYDVGSKRQLWEWYELLNVKYDQVNYTID